MTTDVFSKSERDAVYRVIGERRDMRHFTDGEISNETMERMLEAAHQAPSVGLMQPWRIVRVRSMELRLKIRSLVEDERIATAEALGERHDEFMKLKVDGLDNCAEVLVFCLADKREDFLFGRRTLPEMDLASVSCAIQNLWLASRAEGLGMGWVSLFDPDKLAALLNAPEGAKPIAIVCLGAVEQFYTRPMLVEEGWAKERSLKELLWEDSWQYFESDEAR